jgi:GT2 family glycosyltransferase
MMNYPRVSIIILNWNGVDDTIECLESLKEVTYPNYDIIIVDNASSGDDVRRLRALYGDQIHIIVNEINFGFPGGCNVGMRYAVNKGADYMLLLNNDVKVDPAFLTELIETGEKDPSIGLLGSKIYYYDRPNEIQGAGGRIRWWLGIIEIYNCEDDKGQYNEVAERDFLFGTSLLVRKTLIDKISYMDTYYFFGPEEYDFSLRAKRAGFKVIYVPKSRVWHKSGASRAKLNKFPEIDNLVKSKAGNREYKYYYRFFRTYGPPVLFIIPFILNVTLGGVFLLQIWHGDWEAVMAGIKGRMRVIFQAIRNLFK